MQYNRILVLGNSGSGKTTFTLRLGEITGLPVVHLDKLFWKPGWTLPTREEYHALLRDALSVNAWIMDGDYTSTLAWRLEHCDQVVLFDLPRLICLWGVIMRLIKTYGKNRADMGDGCSEKFDWGFIKFTWYFEKIQGANNKELIRISGKPTVIFRSRRDARRYLEGIRHERASDRGNNTPTADDW